MKNIKFDCVEMKRKAAEMIYEKIKDMSVEEELRFWNGELKGTRKTADSAAKSGKRSSAHTR